MAATPDALGPYSVPAWANLSNVHRLCTRCRTVPWNVLVNRAEDRTALYEPPPDLGHLRSSAHAGCHLCTMLLASLLATRFRRERDGNDFLEEATADVEDDSIVLIDVDWDELDNGRMRRHLKLEIPDSSFGWGGEHALTTIRHS